MINSQLIILLLIYGKLLRISIELQKIVWENDEVIIFGKHIVTKRKVAWYGDSDYLYTYSNTTKQALAWTAMS
jgi:hypothetical protein